jgi:hypothetical protein
MRLLLFEKFPESPDSLALLHCGDDCFNHQTRRGTIQSSETGGFGKSAINNESHR